MKQINYLLGYKDLKIYQDDDMFKFSLDSVLLAYYASVKYRTKNILDIGTGNCVIPLILSLRTSAKIDAVEIQKDVYDIAVSSVNLNNKNEQINVHNADINDFCKENESDYYDLITCNPPFFKVTSDSIINKNDYKSIARHEIKLDLSTLMNVAKKLLKNNGTISIVHRADRFIDIVNTMQENNIEPKRVRFIYPKKGKAANMILIEGTKNGSCGITFEEPLYVYDENLEYTEDILKCFS